MQREEIQFVGEEDLKLVAEAVGSPDAPPVLLLHGGGQTRHSWRQTAESLAQQGWYAVCADLRGHGDSGWSPTGDYSHPRFTGDVIRMARSFETPPVLVGASLGAEKSYVKNLQQTTDKLQHCGISADRINVKVSVCLSYLLVCRPTYRVHAE